jgi:hypothetical protein
MAFCSANTVWPNGVITSSVGSHTLYYLQNISGSSQQYTIGASSGSWAATQGAGTGLDIIVYALDNTCAQTAIITRWYASNPGNSVSPIIQNTHGIIFDVQPDTAAHTAASSVTNSPVAGGGGEPHFVGFDGTRFDFHGSPGAKYTIYQDQHAHAVARFDLEPKAALYPSFQGTTFITELWIDGQHYTPPSVTGLTLPESHHSLLVGQARGIHPQLQTIEGDPIGFAAHYTSNATFLVTALDYKQEFQFLNLSVILHKQDHQTGILGQTARQDRQPNESFRVRTSWL